jgi:hypothetical protein
VGLEGVEPVAFRVRAGCSTVELQTQSGFGEPRSRNLPGKSRLLCRLSYEPSFCFGPPFAGMILGFIVVLVFVFVVFVFVFVWWGVAESNRVPKATGLQPARASTAQNTPHAIWNF